MSVAVDENPHDETTPLLHGNPKLDPPILPVPSRVTPAVSVQTTPVVSGHTTSVVSVHSTPVVSGQATLAGDEKSTDAKKTDSHQGTKAMNKDENYDSSTTAEPTSESSSERNLTPVSETSSERSDDNNPQMAPLPLQMDSTKHQENERVDAATGKKHAALMVSRADGDSSSSSSTMSSQLHSESDTNTVYQTAKDDFQSPPNVSDGNSPADTAVDLSFSDMDKAEKNEVAVIRKRGDLRSPTVEDQDIQ
jgi:hypothetical protein